MLSCLLQWLINLVWGQLCDMAYIVPMHVKHKFTLLYSAYESESDNSIKAIYSDYTDSSGICGCADPHVKFLADPCNNFRNVTFALYESAGHNSICLPVAMIEITVNALLDTGSQATVVSDKLANILGLKSEDFVFVKGATVDTSIQAKTWPNINFEINNMIYKWHVLIAPIEEDLIIGLDFLLHFKIDILFSDGIISIRNSFQNLDSFQIDHSRDNTSEVNEITVNQTIQVKPWSGKFIKLPIACKFGNWKIFESKYFDYVFIPDTILVSRMIALPYST